MLGGNVPYVHAVLARVDQRKHTVVGRYEMVSVARSKYRPARGAHARIYHHYVHGSRGEIGISLRNCERSIQHVKRLHRMADIDNLRLRHDVQDHAFHDAYKMVIAAEVGGQSDDRTLRQSFLAVGRQTIPKTSKLTGSNPGVKARR